MISEDAIARACQAYKDCGGSKRDKLEAMLQVFSITLAQLTYECERQGDTIDRLINWRSTHKNLALNICGKILKANYLDAMYPDDWGGHELEYWIGD